MHLGHTARWRCCPWWWAPIGFWHLHLPRGCHFKVRQQYLCPLPTRCPSFREICVLLPSNPVSDQPSLPFQIALYPFHALSLFSPSPAVLRSLFLPRSGELRTQKWKSHLMRTQSWKVLSLEPGVGQYIAKHVTLTARDFVLAYFHPSGSLICIFQKPLPSIPVLAVAKTGSCVGPQNKIGHPVGRRFPCWVSAEYK